MQLSLASEILAPNKGSETAIYISKILVKLLPVKRMPIVAITDIKSLYQVANTLTPTTEKFLRVDIASVHQLR